MSLIASHRTKSRLMRGVRFIEAHLDKCVSLAGVASQSALSNFHFHRLFRSHFGLPVMDYVRRRRLARAAEALVQTRQPVLLIAMAAGFHSQAAFTRAFRAIYYTTPAQFRRRGREVPWLSSAPISPEILAMLPGLGSEQPRREVIEGFVVEGLADTFVGERRREIPLLWQRLANTVGLERFTQAKHIGISARDAPVLEGILHYMAAVIADARVAVDPRLERRTISGGSYLVFQVEGGARLISAAYDFIFSTWIPRSGHRLNDGPSFATERNPAEGGCSQIVEIWIPVEAA